MNIVRKAFLATTLAATALVSATPAMARDGHRGRGDDTAAIAIGVGILGLAIGAIAASGGRDRYDDRYYVSDGWYYNDNYYYNRSGERYSRNDWQRRYHNNYQHRRNYRDGWHGQRGNRDGWNHDGGDYRRGGEDGYYQRRGY
jgi:hypothetical protein